MKRLSLSVLAAISLSGCVVQDYNMMSNDSGVPEEALSEFCPKLNCSYDKIKGNVQATISDMNTAVLLLSGKETRNIQYTWVSSSTSIIVDVFHKRLTNDWSMFSKAEIYIDRELAASIDSQTDRWVGKYNQVSSQFERIEKVRGVISLDQAKKIASADPSTVTIRFYGKDGYSDETISSDHNLLYLVRLAEAASNN